MGVRTMLIGTTPEGMSVVSYTIGFIAEFFLSNPAFTLVSDTGLSAANERTIILTCGTNPHQIRITNSTASSGYIVMKLMDLAGTTPLISLLGYTGWSYDPTAWFYGVFTELHAYEGAYNFCGRSPNNGSYIGTMLKYTITEDGKYWLWFDTTFYGENSDVAYSLDSPLFTKRVTDGSIFTVQPKLYSGAAYIPAKTQEMYALPTSLDGYTFPNVLTDGTSYYFVVKTDLIFKLS